jgi:hypothetical protein
MTMPETVRQSCAKVPFGGACDIACEAGYEGEPVKTECGLTSAGDKAEFSTSILPECKLATSTTASGDDSANSSATASTTAAAASTTAAASTIAAASTTAAREAAIEGSFKVATSNASSFVVDPQATTVMAVLIADLAGEGVEPKDVLVVLGLQTTRSSEATVLVEYRITLPSSIAEASLAKLEQVDSAKAMTKLIVIMEQQNLSSYSVQVEEWVKPTSTLEAKETTTSRQVKGLPDNTAIQGCVGLTYLLALLPAILGVAHLA